MTDVRFLQIHSLHGYSAVLLNRDDSGLAKRMTYGDAIRTRISSQCLKRHWRMAGGPYALHDIDGASAAVRSREIVTRRIVDTLKKEGFAPEDVDVIGEAFQTFVYGDKGAVRDNRQPLLLGEPEIGYLVSQARSLARDSGSNSEELATRVGKWKKAAKANMKALREGCELPGGLAAALFGRMVTSDVEANIDAAIHVAHAFTVHGEETESDYFTVVDDLHRIEDDVGADHIGETELTSGLFYGYVVLDRQMLLDNLGGDQDMVAAVAERLVHLIATVSPGAKLGSTAPYGYASWMLVEAGDRQPRSLAEAFRESCPPSTQAAEAAACQHLERLDDMYGAGETRRIASLNGASVPDAERFDLPELARWVGAVVRNGST